MILGLVIGFVAAHFFWFAVCAFWWYKMTKEAGQPTHEAINEDFQAIRRSIVEHLRARRN